MDGEGRSGRDETRGRARPRTRRRTLELLGAGAIGGVAGIGLNRLLGTTDDPAEPLAIYRENDSRAYDVISQSRDGGYEAINPDGDTISTGGDGWAVLDDAIQAVPDGGSMFVSGRYTGTSTIDVRKSVRMHGHEAYIEHEQTGDYALRFEGEERRQTTLAEPTTTGDHTIELEDTADMETGDLVLLEEEDGDPVLGREQPPGEPHSVLAVDDATVRLEDSIVWRDEYPAGSLVYVIDPIQVHVSGFRLTSPAKDESYYGITCRQCRDSIFENLWLDRFGSRGITVEASANVRIRDCTVLRSSDIEAADGYGVQVRAGCHDIIVEGCAAKECRHPLSVTPAGAREVASRAITFRDCFVSADGSAALNCHGGSAHDVRFEGCTVHTPDEAGLRTGAQETNVSGCEFRMDGHNAIGTRNDGQEMILTVTDTDVFGAGSVVHLDREDEYEFEPVWELVHLDGVRAYGSTRFFELEGGAIDRVRDVVITGCYWNEIEDEGVRIRNRIDRGTIANNHFGAAPEGSHIHVRDTSDTEVENVQVVGNSFLKLDGADTFIRLSRCENCVVSENKFTSETDVLVYRDDAGSTANLIKENTYVAPDASEDPIDEDGGSTETDNHVYDTEAEEWL